MNREIKFRAWNKIWEMMSMVDKIEFEDGNPYSVSTTIKATDFDHTDEWSDYEVGDEIILQQFTGLKDKNGKEIYEGDIIGNAEFPHLLIIGFNTETLSFCGSKSNNHNIENCYWFENDIVLGEDNWEVIGNIYENPELLEGK